MKKLLEYQKDFENKGFHHGLVKKRFLLIRHFISAPFIYSGLIIVPVIDIVFETYHRIGFFMYGIPYVDRSKYIRIDRHKLKKLNIVDRMNCVYCGYVNGWLAYAAKIAGETEKYWCAIMHEEKYGFKHLEHQKNFETRTQYE